MEIYRSLTRLGQLIADIPWPVDFFSPEDLPTFLDHIYVQDYQFEITATGFFTTFWLAFEDELSVSLPGLEGVKLVVGGDVPGFTFVNATLIIGDGSSLTLNNISLALRFDPSILKPAALNPGDPIPDFVEIQVTGSIRISSSFDVDIEGFNAFKLTPAMIGELPTSKDVRTHHSM